MASSPRGLRLLKAMEIVQKKPFFETTTVLKKTNLQSAYDGVLKGSFIVEPATCNMGAGLHGGFIASVVDVFSFYSQLSHPNGRASWTKTINITYLGSAKEGERVNVETKPLQIGNFSTVETKFHNDSGKLLAKAIATFSVGSEDKQHLVKDEINFDVFEN